ncbi:MAG: DUF3761 domain-containing protein [Bacteroidales bacterium]|jgi:hypothetical protein
MKKFILSTLIIGSLFIASTPTVEAKIKVSHYGATALCRDGTYSYSKTHRGTCSWHKGVRIWYK